MNCCDAFGNCNQGRDCPARLQPAECCTEIGCEIGCEGPRDVFNLSDALLCLALVGTIALLIAVGGIVQ